jgi:hypothetical protein
MTLGRAFWLTGDRRYRRAFCAELASWLDGNPPLVGVNWASMLELALRSLSWIWALHFFVEPPVGGRPPESGGADTEDGPWTVDLLLGLDTQLAQVERHLSYYFSPNTHLLGEALALYVAGRTLPILSASSRRARVGRDLLIGEASRQIEPDGGHRERSTHYHKYTLDFYLLALAVARITGDPASDDFERTAARLAAAARQLADSRGRLPHFGDDDGGMLAPFTGRPPDDVRDSLALAAGLLNRPELCIAAAEEAHWVLASAPEASRHALDVVRRGHSPSSCALADTGYYISRSRSGDHLVIDGGPHGFQNGGHAHADALSLTFSRRSAPLLIDPGTACYTIDPARRDWFRSTAMHNTVVVDGRSQSTPDGPFHWARTARTTVRRWHSADRFDYFEGMHDGYAPVLHRRHVLAMHDDLIVIADLVLDLPERGAHRVAVHWHVDPRWAVQLGDRLAHLSSRAGRVDLAVTEGGMEVLTGDTASGLGLYSPAYGRVEPATTVRLVREGAGPIWIASVFGLNARNPVLRADAIPVWAEAGVLADSTGVRIARERSVDYALFAPPLAPARAANPRRRPGAPRTWRVADIETDARALLCRVNGNAAMSTLAVVDGSIVRRPRAGRPAPDSRQRETLCAASPAS